MKEYIVLNVKCKKGLSATDIYSYVKQRVKYNSNFFAFQNIYFSYLSKGTKALYDKLNLDDFAYIKVLEHLAKSQHYNPERDDRRMVSNMDSRWRWYNERVNDTLEEEQLALLASFCDKLKGLSFSTLIFGLDEIEWGGTKVGRGTYGFAKADCTYQLGNNYLSNSVTVGRSYSDKVYIVNISLEKQFQGLAVIEDLVAFLGEKVYETTYFAPENDEERSEWEQTAQEAKTRFEQAIAGAGNLPLTHFTENTRDETPKIDVRKLIKKYLCNDGWEMRKAHWDEYPTIIHKAKDNTEICMSIVSGHNGHHLQHIVCYRSKMFRFAEHIRPLYSLYISEENMDKQFQNIRMVRDYLYEVL